MTAIRILLREWSPVNIALLSSAHPLRYSKHRQSCNAKLRNRQARRLSIRPISEMLAFRKTALRRKIPWAAFPASLSLIFASIATPMPTQAQLVETLAVATTLANLAAASSSAKAAQASGAAQSAMFHAVISKLEGIERELDLILKTLSTQKVVLDSLPDNLIHQEYVKRTPAILRQVIDAAVAIIDPTNWGDDLAITTHQQLLVFAMAQASEAHHYFLSQLDAGNSTAAAMAAITQEAIAIAYHAFAVSAVEGADRQQQHSCLRMSFSAPAEHAKILEEAGYSAEDLVDCEFHHNTPGFGFYNQLHKLLMKDIDHWNRAVAPKSPFVERLTKSLRTSSLSSRIDNVSPTTLIDSASNLLKILLFIDSQRGSFSGKQYTVWDADEPENLCFVLLPIIHHAVQWHVELPELHGRSAELYAPEVTLARAWLPFGAFVLRGEFPVSYSYNHGVPIGALVDSKGNNPSKLNAHFDNYSISFDSFDNNGSLEIDSRHGVLANDLIANGADATVHVELKTNGDHGDVKLTQDGSFTYTLFDTHKLQDHTITDQFSYRLTLKAKDPHQEEIFSEANASINAAQTHIASTPPHTVKKRVDFTKSVLSPPTIEFWMADTGLLRLPNGYEIFSEKLSVLTPLQHLPLERRFAATEKPLLISAFLSFDGQEFSFSPSSVDIYGLPWPIHHDRDPNVDEAGIWRDWLFDFVDLDPQFSGPHHLGWTEYFPQVMSNIESLKAEPSDWGTFRNTAEGPPRTLSELCPPTWRSNFFSLDLVPGYKVPLSGEFFIAPPLEYTYTTKASLIVPDDYPEINKNVLELIEFLTRQLLEEAFVLYNEKFDADFLSFLASTFQTDFLMSGDISAGGLTEATVIEAFDVVFDSMAIEISNQALHNSRNWLGRLESVLGKP